MNDIEKNLNKKLEYLYSMSFKYIDLNKVTKNAYSWRLHGIYEQIEALEELQSGVIDGTFDECYAEDLKESNK